MARACARKESLMSQAKYYWPKITHDLESRLYWKGQSQPVPMTKLVDQSSQKVFADIAPAG
ncbi:MAG: hypothetical protein DME86_03435 [Verrucomicrobia bacterium]|nr:MAG: hypothetical protein DME86_03435 [Verrucomicrobiota bacterium]